MSKTELVGFFQRNHRWVTVGKVLLGGVVGVLGTAYAMGSSSAHTADHLEDIDRDVKAVSSRVTAIEIDRLARGREAAEERAIMKADIAGIKQHEASIDSNFQWLRDRLVGKP